MMNQGQQGTAFIGTQTGTIYKPLLGGCCTCNICPYCGKPRNSHIWPPSYTQCQPGSVSHIRT